MNRRLTGDNLPLSLLRCFDHFGNSATPIKHVGRMHVNKTLLHLTAQPGPGITASPSASVTWMISLPGIRTGRHRLASVMLLIPRHRAHWPGRPVAANCSITHGDDPSWRKAAWPAGMFMTSAHGHGSEARPFSSPLSRDLHRLSWLLANDPLALGGEGFQDLVGGLGPGEWPGVLVPLVDPLADVGFQLCVSALPYPA
jgi:hypothetical protein